MSLHRYAPQRDGNERLIVAVFRSLGCVVAQISGAGVPDLLVSLDGVLYLVEVKNGAKKKLKPAQERWHAQWKALGGAWPWVVHSEAEARAAVEKWRGLALERANATPCTLEDDLGQWHEPEGER